MANVNLELEAILEAQNHFQMLDRKSEIRPVVEFISAMGKLECCGT